MKKLFTFILLSFATMMASAQDATLTTEATFDFSKPSELSPVPEFGDRTSISVDNTKFTVKDVSVTFAAPQSTGKPSYFAEGYIALHRGESMLITCPSGYELLSISFPNNNILGGIELASGTKGTLDRTTYPVAWRNVDSDGNTIEGIKAVNFYNSNQDAKIFSFSVTYRSPLDVLETVTVTPENGSTVEAFDALTLTFDHEISATAQQFQLTDGMGTVAYLTPSVSGKTVTLTPTAALTEAGTYSVSFPKNSFISKEGYYNKAFRTSFTYVLPQNTFNPVSITPAEGAVQEMPATIELDFRDPIGNRSNADNPGDIQYIVANITDTKTGIVVGAAQGSLKSGTENILVLTSNLPADARTKRGIYTVTIPEQRVYNRFYNTTSPELRYNSEIVITYKVAGADAPSEAVLAEARELLNKTGVGYPKADAAERTALAAAVEAEDKGDEAFRTLMDNFMASTDIELPEADKYYTIANVQKDGTKFYLAYDGEAVTLTTDAANAYSFKAATTDDATTGNVRTFATADGKYLHTLVSSTNYSEVSPSNVTSEKKAVSSLSLVKMPCQANAEAEQVFGYIAMSGLVGKKYNQGDDITAFSNVLSSGNIAEGETSPYFMENLSGAFFFAESEAPKVITKYTVTVNPVTETGIVEALESIVVTFPEVTAITLADESKISLKGVKTNVVVPVYGTPVVEGNAVTIKFGFLQNDTYTFTAAEGAFTYVKDEETVTVQEITTSFTVNYVDEFLYDLNALPNEVILDNNWGNNKINPRELNNLSIQLQDGKQNSIETYLNPDAEVDLLYNMSMYVAKGKFEKYTTSETYTENVFMRNGEEVGVVWLQSGTQVVLVDGTKYTDYGMVPGDEIVEKVRTKYYYHMRLKLNKEMNEQTAKDGLYWFNIPAETFGDAMYNSWLNGAAVAKHECHVNRFLQIAIETDKTATAITDVNADEMRKDVIFDISGRRVKNTSAPGLYIINGKKHVVK